MPVYYQMIDSPLGPLLLAGDGVALTGVYLDTPGRPDPQAAGWVADREALAEAHAQLEAYFAGRRQHFELPLAPEGTAFQRRVWQALGDIPPGETRSYGELAAAIGRPGAARAVGLANGRNPIAIVVPCHRVIGADGRLTGYAGGLARKRWLLTHERRMRAATARDAAA